MVGFEPCWVAGDPVTGRVCVTTHCSNELAVIWGDQVWRRIPVGRGAFGVAGDVHGRRAYVGNRDDKTVSVVNLNTNAVVQTLRQDGSPFGMGVDKMSGKLYVMSGTQPSTCPAHKQIVFSGAGTNLGQVGE